MPLRDHFHPPMTNFASWEELHGAWPGVIAFRLNTLLPAEYRSGVKIHLGSLVEIDVGTFEMEPMRGDNAGAQPDASAAWRAAAPTLLLETEELTPPEYEVRVYDLTNFQRLVAAVEIVSPRKKDRTEARDAFVSKCHALLLEQVCVVIVDPVTTRSANLFAELAQRLGARRPAVSDEPIYAVSCRVRNFQGGQRVETWEHPLSVGAALPTLPLWIHESQFVPLELEQTYEDTCRGLRLPCRALMTTAPAVQLLGVDRPPHLWNRPRRQKEQWTKRDHPLMASGGLERAQAFLKSDSSAPTHRDRDRGCAAKAFPGTPR